MGLRKTKGLSTLPKYQNCSSVGQNTSTWLVDDKANKIYRDEIFYANILSDVEVKENQRELELELPSGGIQYMTVILK